MIPQLLREIRATPKHDKTLLYAVKNSTDTTRENVSSANGRSLAMQIGLVKLIKAQNRARKTEVHLRSAGQMKGQSNSGIAKGEKRERKRWGAPMELNPEHSSPPQKHECAKTTTQRLRS